jgi:TPR repeat protein
MQNTNRMPQIAWPFALVGASAGWLWPAFLANPLVDCSYRSDSLPAAACGLVVASGVGAVLTKRCKPTVDWAGPGATWIWLVLTVVLGGAVAGAALAALTWRTREGVFGCGFGGVACGLTFLPICAVVVAAARRAARARLGSLVASADARTMWSTAITAVGVSTLLATADWPASMDATVPRPIAALAIAMSAGLAMIALLAFDLRAWAELRRIEHARSHMVALSPENDDDTPAPEIDLGLGNELVVALERQGYAFRSSERIAARTRGSPAASRVALRSALRGKMVGLASIGCVLAAHRLAAGAEARLWYDEHRCAAGLPYSCIQAAARLRTGDGVRRDAERAADLYEDGCDGPYGAARSCAARAEMLESGELGTPDTSRASALREKACEFGDADSCYAHALYMMHDHLERAASDVRRACALRGRRGCESDEHAASWDTISKADEGEGVTRLDRQVAACARGSAADCIDAAGLHRQANAPDRGEPLIERATSLVVQ